MLHFNDHLYTKFMYLFVGSEYLVSHRRFRTPRHFYGLSPLELCLTTINGSFTQGGVYPCLLLPDTSFLYHIIQPCDSVRLCPLDRAHPINTKHSVDSSTMHSHLFNAMSPCICNAMCYCMLYHATCIMKATWNTQTTPLTGCHGKSHHLHMISIHHSFKSIYHAHIYQHQHTTCHSMFK